MNLIMSLARQGNNLNSLKNFYSYINYNLSFIFLSIAQTNKTKNTIAKADIKNANFLALPSMAS
jgi:hypothetical protein